MLHVMEKAVLLHPLSTREGTREEGTEGGSSLKV